MTYGSSQFLMQRIRKKIERENVNLIHYSHMNMYIGSTLSFISLLVQHMQLLQRIYLFYI